MVSLKPATDPEDAHRRTAPKPALSLGESRNRHGDYTSERDLLFAGETLDQIIADIKQTRPGGDASANIAEAEPRS